MPPGIGYRKGESRLMNRVTKQNRDDGKGMSDVGAARCARRVEMAQPMEGSDVSEAIRLARKRREGIHAE